MPGRALVVYDTDSALVTDILACEDAHESERTGAAPRRKSLGDTWLALWLASSCPPLVSSNRLRGQDLERDDFKDAWPRWPA